MTIKFKNKTTGQLIEAMQHDGTNASAIGLSVWAGAHGETINMQYRGGDANDWVLTIPTEESRNEEVVGPGWWLTQWPDGTFHSLDADQVTVEFELVEES